MKSVFLELAGHEWGLSISEQMERIRDELGDFFIRYAIYFYSGNRDVATNVFGSLEAFTLESMNQGNMRSYFLNSQVNITWSLQNACRQGLVQAVKTILESGRANEIRKEDFGIAIFYAASMGHLEILDLLLESKKEAIIPKGVMSALKDAVSQIPTTKVEGL